MKELIERRIRQGVMESRRGRLVEGSVCLDDSYKFSYMVRYKIWTVDQRRMRYGTEFSRDGDLIATLFN